MKISVVIPTYKRADILKLTLESLANQSLSGEQYEVIVVDDGSDDGGETEKVVKSFMKIRGKSQEKQGQDTKQGEDTNKNTTVQAPQFTYIYQKNQKQGIARNNGISHAKGKIILIIGDDMIPASSNLLEQHLKLHETHPEETYGVLGFTDWHPDLQQNGAISHFMKWLTHGSCVLGKYGGHQFAYEKLGGGPDGKDAFGKKALWRVKTNERQTSGHSTYADYNFFYTSNISLKKSLLSKEQFDPNFSAYGWEDIELGYRLEKKHGFKLLYNPHAVVLHHHLITEESLAPRMRMIAKSASVISKKYPELNIQPSQKKIRLFKILAHPITLHIFKLLSKIDRKWLNYFYYGLSKKYYLEGLKQERPNR